MHVTVSAAHKDRTVEIGLTAEDGARMWPDWETWGVADRAHRLAQAADLLVVQYAEDEGWLSPEYAQRRRHEIARRGKK